MKLELDSGFRPKLDWYNICPLWRQFFLKLRCSYQNCLAILRFSDSPWDDCPNLESHGQTMRVGLHIVVLRSYHLQWTSIIDSSEGYRLAVHVISTTHTSFKMVNKHLWMLLVLFNRVLAWGGAGPAPPPPFFCLRKSKHARIKVENKNSSPGALKQNVCSIPK